MVEVKNGIPKIISSPSETNLDFKIFSFEAEMKDIEITLEDKSVVNAENFIFNQRISFVSFLTNDESQWKRGYFKRAITQGQEKGDFTYSVRDDVGRKKEQKGSFVIKKLIKKEIGSYKYNFNTTNIKHLLFNEAPTYHDITEVVGSVEENKFKLIFNKTVAFFDGWWGYDDWIKVLLAQVCVYKLK